MIAVSTFKTQFSILAKLFSLFFYSLLRLHTMDD